MDATIARIPLPPQYRDKDEAEKIAKDQARLKYITAYIDEWQDFKKHPWRKSMLELIRHEMSEKRELEMRERLREEVKAFYASWGVERWGTDAGKGLYQPSRLELAMRRFRSRCRFRR